MRWDQKSLRVGAAVILCALGLRWICALAPKWTVQALGEPEDISRIFFVKTGYELQPAAAQTAETQPQESHLEETLPSPVPAAFTQEDAAQLTFRNTADISLDPTALLLQPLEWDLYEDSPSVLILHSHTCESYEKTEDYVEDSQYRTQDERYNMLSIGDALAQALEAAGIGVIHDRAVHDYPSYNGSYNHARESISAYLSQYPSIRLVLDLHRDALATENGAQLGSTVSINGQETAQLMLVMGSDKGGLTHPSWQENLALAVKFQAAAQRLYPGLCRPINLRSQRFNQDLSPGALLIEVGAAGNTRQEALNAAAALGEIILYLANGTQ